MLLIIIVFVLFAACVAVAALVDNYTHDVMQLLAVIGAVILGVALVVMCCGLVSGYIEKNADTVGLQQEYESLYYQASTGMYENLNDVGKQELASQITEWNVKISRKQVLEKSIWVSVFYPVDYSQFKLIPIELIQENAKS